MLEFLTIPCKMILMHVLHFQDNTIEMKKIMTTADSLFTTSKLLNNPTERLVL